MSALTDILHVLTSTSPAAEAVRAELHTAIDALDKPDVPASGSENTKEGE